MKIIYSHENKILVENAKNLLMQNGIQVSLRNEFSAGGLGELAFTDTWPQLWVVNDEDYEKAELIIAPLSSVSEGEQWPCGVCNENNESSFELCWRCQNERI